MKKFMKSILSICLCLGLTGCAATSGTAQNTGFNLWRVILAVLGVALLALAAFRTYSLIRFNRQRARSPRRRPPRKMDIVTYGLYALGAIALAAALLITVFGGTGNGGNDPAIDPDSQNGPSSTIGELDPILFNPEKTAQTAPANWGIEWEIFENGTALGSFEREEPIRFGDPDEYFSLPGIGAFRGNNYRNSATYGTADVTQETLSAAWTTQTSTLPGSTWSGSGWTGQPLIVKWDETTKQNMNLYPEKKAKADLVEVIYATLDGNIYFLDLDDGSYTRNPLTMGMCFKGAGSLDPRGYPLMYVGSGDVNSSGKKPRMFIISLIDCTVLYEYGNNDPLSFRKDNEDWSAFDSSPLVHANTDTLIWPGENGILYTIRLNTVYDRDAGTVSISPDAPIVTRYDTDRSNEETYWYGYEASANIVENYLYVSENGGMFYCVDLNTMELVWAQDTKDDSNSTPVFERISEEEGYVYTAPSLHWTKNSNSEGYISIYKLNALTGEIVWETPYYVNTIDGVSGGVQSSPLLGKEDSTIDGLIIYTIARIPHNYTGIMVALDTETGEEVWRMDMDWYTWSSPVAVYEDDGTAYIVVCDADGNAFLVEGATGQICDRINLGGLVEASPAVYEDMLVVGTREELICGVKIK